MVEKEVVLKNSPNQCETLTQITIERPLKFAIQEMICTLKNLDGEYTYCKGLLRKIYGAILEDVTGGGIKVTSKGTPHNFGCEFHFRDEWKKFNVSKNYERKPLDSERIFDTYSKPKKIRKHISGKVRQNVFMRDNYTCQICGRTIDDGISLHLDHIIPVSKGGSNKENNLQTLCNQCNREKHNRTDLLHDKLMLNKLKGEKTYEKYSQ